MTRPQCTEGFDPARDAGILARMWRLNTIAAALTLCATFAVLAGCDSQTLSAVPLAPSVQAALDDPSGLPRAVTPTSPLGTEASATATATAKAAPPPSPAAQIDAGASAVSVDAAVAVVAVDAGDARAVAHDTMAANISSRDAGDATPTRPKPEDDNGQPAARPSPAQKRTLGQLLASKKGRVDARKASKINRKADRRRTPTAAPKRHRAAKVAPKPALDDVPLPPGKDATDLYYDGKRAMGARQYDAAIAALKGSQRLRPSSRTLALLGQAYFDANRLKDAERVLRRAGNRADALLMLATLYQQQGRSARARRVLKALLTYHPDHARADWARRMLKAL